MVKWQQLPEDFPLQYNPYQVAFWEAHRKRICRECKIEFDCPPNFVCPQCGRKGTRKFDRLAVIAGRRGGKTRAGAIVGVEEATVPGTIGWACAPTNPKLYRYVIPAFQKLIPPEWVKSWSSEHNDLWLKNDSLIHFQTLEHPDQGRGQGLDWGWIDEACELSLNHWEIFSPSLVDRQGLGFVTTSPRGFDWVWENFYHVAEQGVPGYWACRYKTSDNPIISSEQLEREKAIKSDAIYRQEYEADFVIFTGAVYGDLIGPTILRTQKQVEEVIPEWPDIASWRPVYIGLDTGADHPFGAVKVVGTEKGLVVVGEYLERNKTFAQHASAIKHLAGRSDAHFAINKNEKQPMLELGQHGIYCGRAENDVVAGTERVKSWLHTRQLYFIENAVPKTIKQLQAYRWADNEAADGQLLKEKVYKLNDELPDCLRYVCMIYPKLPTPPEIITPERDLTSLPPEVAASIERMRKFDKEPKEQGVVGDFWG